MTRGQLRYQNQRERHWPGSIRQTIGISIVRTVSSFPQAFNTGTSNPGGRKSKVSQQIMSLVQMGERLHSVCGWDESVSGMGKENHAAYLPVVSSILTAVLLSLH